MHCDLPATDRHERLACRLFDLRSAAWICHKSHRVRRNTRQVTEALGPSRDSAAGASHFSQFDGRLFVLVDRPEAAPTALPCFRGLLARLSKSGNIWPDAEQRDRQPNGNPSRTGRYGWGPVTGPFRRGSVTEVPRINFIEDDNFVRIKKTSPIDPVDKLQISNAWNPTRLATADVKISH